MRFSSIHYLSPQGQLEGPVDIDVQGTQIFAIAPSLGPTEDEQIDGRGKLLLPAFFNAHCHLPMTLLRGYGEGLPLMSWLEDRVFPFEALLDGEDYYWGTLLAAAELIQGGCAGVSDMYFGLEGIIRAVEESGIKANLAWANSDSDPKATYKKSRSFEGNRLTLAHAKAHPHGRIKAELALHAEYSSHEALAHSVLDYAVEEGLSIQVHVSETKGEHEACKAKRGKTPLAYLHSLGYFKRPLILAHCVYLEDSDYALLQSEIEAGAKVSLVHNPISNLKLGSGIAPLKRWEESKVNIALGTDGACSNNNLDLLRDLQVASLLQKGLTGDPATLGPAQVFRMASLGGAMAQERSDTGSIAVGQKADLLLYDLEAFHSQPVYDPLAALLHSAKSEDLAMTMVDGKVLYTKSGGFKTLDLERILFEVRRIQKEKLSALGVNLPYRLRP